jgi:hypothetical protein
MGLTMLYELIKLLPTVLLGLFLAYAAYSFHEATVKPLAQILGGVYAESK